MAAAFNVLESVNPASQLIPVARIEGITTVMGARDGAHVRKVRRLLLRYDHFPIDGLGDYERAAAVYRSCRDKGQSVRSLTDCLIATVAIRERVPVLEQDRDFKVIAAHTELRLHTRA